ncbi:coiled-coil domain-containing protein 8-like [Kogia breviceps]|uniref:coiled-coil domain-containing protein 8-like n=1 Tax=Kogia breviceps TaxID=27615 RepID=UPI0034D19D06
MEGDSGLQMARGLKDGEACYDTGAGEGGGGDLEGKGAWMLRNIKGLGGPDRRPFRRAALHLPSTMTSALRCACAFTLLRLQLLPPRFDGALAEEVQVPRRLRPRVARWLPNFGQLNKYIEKLCNSSPERGSQSSRMDVFPSMKSKNAKNSNDANNPENTPPANATKPPSANATKLPRQNAAKLPRQNATKLPRQNATKLPRQNTTNPPRRDAAKPRPAASSQGPSSYVQGLTTS